MLILFLYYSYQYFKPLYNINQKKIVNVKKIRIQRKIRIIYLKKKIKLKQYCEKLQTMFVLFKLFIKAADLFTIFDGI